MAPTAWPVRVELVEQPWHLGVLAIPVLVVLAVLPEVDPLLVAVVAVVVESF